MNAHAERNIHPIYVTLDTAMVVVVTIVMVMVVTIVMVMIR